MSANVPRRREWVAFGAGVTVLAGLMAIVALSGNVVTAKKPVVQIDQARLTAMNER